MTCRTYRQWMSEHLDARLDARRTDRLLAHLAACPECRARFNALNRTVGLVRALPRLAPNPDLARIVRRRIAADQAAPPSAAPRVAFFARPPARIALAAGVLLMVCLYGWVWRPDSRPVPSPTRTPPPPCVARLDEPAPCMPAEKALATHSLRAGKAEFAADAAADKSDVVPHERRFRADDASVAGILDALRPPHEKRASARRMTIEAAVGADAGPERAGAAPERKEFEQSKAPSPIVTRTGTGISEIQIRVRQSDLPRVLADLAARGIVVKPATAPASAPAPVLGRQRIATARGAQAPNAESLKSLGSAAPSSAGAAAGRPVESDDIPDNGWVTLIIEVPEAP